MNKPTEQILSEWREMAENVNSNRFTDTSREATPRLARALQLAMPVVAHKSPTIAREINRILNGEQP